MTAPLLLASLKMQEANLIKLYAVLQNQKEAIVKNNYEELEKSIQVEQKVLQSVEHEENIRVKLIKDIARQNKLTLRSDSLEELLTTGSHVFKKEMKEINTLRNSVKEKAAAIKRLNSQLKDVIEFSRNLIKETLTMIVGNNKRALVNKRV